MTAKITAANRGQSLAIVPMISGVMERAIMQPMTACAMKKGMCGTRSVP